MIPLALSMVGFPLGLSSQAAAADGKCRLAGRDLASSSAVKVVQRVKRYDPGDPIEQTDRITLLGCARSTGRTIRIATVQDTVNENDVYTNGHDRAEFGPVASAGHWIAVAAFESFPRDNFASLRVVNLATADRYVKTLRSEWGPWSTTNYRAVVNARGRSAAAFVVPGTASEGGSVSSAICCGGPNRMELRGYTKRGNRLLDSGPEPEISLSSLHFRGDYLHWKKGSVERRSRFE